MLTVELKELNVGARKKKVLVVNGREVENSYASEDADGISVTLRDPEVADEVFSNTFALLAERFWMVSVPYQPDWLEECWVDIRIMFRDAHPRFRRPCIYFELNYDWEVWAHPWSVLDFASRLKQLIEDHGTEECSYSQVEPDMITVEAGMLCEIAHADRIVNDELAIWLRFLGEIATKAVTELNSDASKDTLVTLFKFPSEVATACEQYLIYFSQFLKDLGIDANVGIRHEASSVLFSVTPTTGAEALDNVRQALDIYLSLPSAPHRDNVAGESRDIAVQQLQANIYHLKSQVILSLAMVQAQKAQIEALELSNYRHKQLLAMNGWTENHSRQSGEPILNGLVEIRPLEVKGATINLPEIWRLLKRRVTGR